MKPLLTVDTKGHCLLCYEVLNCESRDNCQVALQALFCYLKVDHKKIINFSPHFLSQLELAQDDFDVAALTCPRCSAVVNWFHNAYQASEHHRLEMEQSLMALHQIMDIGGNDTNLVREYAVRTQPKKPEQLGNAVGANVLRKETFTNCEIVLNQFQPRVKICRMETDFLNFPPLLRRQCDPPQVTKLNNMDTVPSPPVKLPKLMKRSKNRSCAKPWRCQFCPTRMRLAANLKTHTMRRHTAEIVSAVLSASGPCSQSDVANGISKVLQKVKKNGPGRNKCLFCHSRLRQRSLVKLHMMEQHLREFADEVKIQVIKRSQERNISPPRSGKSSEEFKCSLCSRKFTSQSHFKNHHRICMKLHMSENEYQKESQVGKYDLGHTSKSAYTPTAVSTQEDQLPPEVVDEFMEAVEQYNLELHDVLSTVTAV